MSSIEAQLIIELLHKIYLHLIYLSIIVPFVCSLVVVVVAKK